MIVNAFRSRFDSIQWPNSKSRTIFAPRVRGIVGKAQPVLKPLISGEDLRLPFVRRLQFGRGSLAICGHCGRKLRTHYTSRTASPVYHCAGASASAPCRSTRLWAAPDRRSAICAASACGRSRCRACCATTRCGSTLTATRTTRPRTRAAARRETVRCAGELGSADCVARSVERLFHVTAIIVAC